MFYYRLQKALGISLPGITFQLESEDVVYTPKKAIPCIIPLYCITRICQLSLRFGDPDSHEISISSFYFKLEGAVDWGGGRTRYEKVSESSKSTSTNIL